MPATRAASSREAPSSTRAKASIRREAAVSRHRLASRRSSPAPSSFRVIATVMAPPPIGYTADQPRPAPRGSGRDDASAIRTVGISRQSWLAELVLDRAQEGLRVATEAAAQDAGSTPLLEAVADLAPPAPIGRGEVARLVTAEPGERRRDEPHRAAQHRRRRARLAARPPPLVTAVPPEQPFEVVVGARQAGDGVAVEQAGPVAAGHLQEVVDGAGERAGLGAVAAGGGDQAG